MEIKPIKRSKFLRFLFIGLALLILLAFIASTLLLRTGVFDGLTASVLEKIIEDRSKSPTEIGSAKFGVSEIILRDIVIRDHKDSIMFIIKGLRIGYNRFWNSIRRTSFRSLEVKDIHFIGLQHKGDKNFNFQYFIWNMGGERKSGKAPKKIVFKSVVIRNGRFDFTRAQHDRSRGKMNYDDMHFRDINVVAENLVAKGQRLSWDVVSMKAEEKSGLAIKSAVFSFVADTGQISFNKMNIQIGNTLLRGKYRMLFDDYGDFGYYLDKVVMNGEFTDTKLYVDDLLYFTDTIPSDQKWVTINGIASGTVKNLKSNHISLAFGRNFTYRGSFKLIGLPDYKETFIDLNMKDMDVSIADIKTLVPAVSFPDYLMNSGRMKLNGRFTGFLNDFVTYGSLKTIYGDISTDLNFKIPATSAVPTYSGKLVLKDFELGKLFNAEKYLGKVSLTTTVQGKGLNLKDAQANIDTKADYVVFNGYKMKNISAKGLISRRIFEGSAGINDENVSLDFHGGIDYTQAKPLYRFTADIKNLELYKLNLVKDTFRLRTLLDIDVKANNPDDAVGIVTALNTSITTAEQIIQVKTIVLSSDISDDIRQIGLRSDIAEASINGKFMISEVPNLFKYAFAAYFDSSIIVLPKKDFSSDFVNYSVKLKNSSFINKLIKLPVVFEDKTTVRGQIDNSRGVLRMSATLPGLYYKNLYLNNLVCNVSNDKGNLIIYSSLDHISSKDSVILRNLNFSAESNPHEIRFNGYFFYEPFENHLTLSGLVHLFRDSMLLKLENSTLMNRNQKWDLRTDMIRINYKPEIDISLLELKNKENATSIKALGFIGKSYEKYLRVIVSNVEFQQLAAYLPWDLSFFSGPVNGQAVIFNLLDKPFFDAALMSQNFIWEKQDTLGMVMLSASHNVNNANTTFSGSLFNSEMQEQATLSGYIDFIKDKNIDLTFSTPRIAASALQPFLRGLIHGLDGDVTGTVKFYGPLKDYKVNGVAELINTSFNVDYTLTRYSLNAAINMDEKGIYLENISVFDYLKNKALVNGRVNHDHFRDFFFDIQILASNLHGLNTGVEDNSYFYGQAYASGKLEFIGPLEEITMNMQLLSEKNTMIYLPLYSDNTFGNYNFIRFINRSSPAIYKPTSSLYSVNLNLDMQITPNASIELIFDPETDDIIRGNGSGNLKLQVDKDGNITMYGSYSIEKGDYTFTALDVINRKFTVKQGGTITWKGDPYDADLNIEAVYALNASVADLLPADQRDASVKQAIPVDAKLFLTGSLYSPDIKLDFDLNTGSSISGSKVGGLDLEQRIRAIKNDEQELNKQVISLLVINRFLPVESLNQSDVREQAFSSVAVGSLISGQVAQWLSQVSSSFMSKYLKDFQFGLNYQQADNKQTEQELGFLLSTSLFNDRVRFSGSYDLGLSNTASKPNTNFQVDWQIREDGKLRFKVFSRSENNPFYDLDINRNGIGIFYRYEFDKWSQLFRRKKDSINL